MCANKNLVLHLEGLAKGIHAGKRRAAAIAFHRFLFWPDRVFRGGPFLAPCVTGLAAFCRIARGIFGAFLARFFPTLIREYIFEGTNSAI